jgi:hypothetical protein
MDNRFKKNTNLRDRIRNSSVVIDKYYPDKVPVVIQKLARETYLPELKKNKFLIPGNMSYSSFLIYLRGILTTTVSPSTAIFLSTEGGHMMCSSDKMLNVYQNHSDNQDNFLYLFYCSENTFG